MRLKNLIHFFIIVILIHSSISCSSLKSEFFPKNFTAARSARAADLSYYSDEVAQVEDIIPGKTIDLYIFYNQWDLIRWQNAQGWLYDKDNHMDWKPKGPLSPYWKAMYELKDKYGEKGIISLQIDELIQPCTYYTSDEFSKLGEWTHFFDGNDTLAQGCLETSSGIYLITICNPEHFNKMVVSRAEKKLHKNDIGIQTVYIPKEFILPKPVKLVPAKVKPYVPSQIPDSSINLDPACQAPESINDYVKKTSRNLQWLALSVACKGVYDMAYAGDFLSVNPIDYYKTSHIKNYLASNNGRASRGTKLFEGICFDYADFAYQEFNNNRADYSTIKRAWMVGTFENPNNLVVYRIANANEEPTIQINNTPVIILGAMDVKAHGNAKNHAWLWVECDNGEIWWIDPTWTDNRGRPVFGIVKGLQEVELEPDEDLCVH